MAEVSALGMFPFVLAKDEEKIDEFEFQCELAEYACEYIDELAKPLMMASYELWENPAIVYLVHNWYEEHNRARGCRVKYIQDHANYDAEFPPYEYRSWHKDNERFLKQVLDALLIHAIN